MTSVAAAVAQPLPVNREDKVATGAWGMLLVITTEAALFVYLLFSYFYLASMARGAWPPSGLPELRLALPNTAVLLLSSATMWWADGGIERGSTGRLRLGLGLTLLLGGIFLSIQAVEYGHLQFTPRTSAYGSLFYTITSFHGAHVLVGLMMIGFILARALRGDFSTRRHLAVKVVGWYWHFVDLVWLAVFTSLYLSPRFL